MSAHDAVEALANAATVPSAIEAQECAKRQHYTGDRQVRNVAGVILTGRLHRLSCCMFGRPRFLIPSLLSASSPCPSDRASAASSLSAFVVCLLVCVPTPMSWYLYFSVQQLCETR